MLKNHYFILEYIFLKSLYYNIFEKLINANYANISIMEGTYLTKTGLILYTKCKLNIKLFKNNLVNNN